MQAFASRFVRASLILGLFFSSSVGSAEQGPSDKQRREYGRVFGAAGGGEKAGEGPAPVARPAAVNAASNLTSAEGITSGQRSAYARVYGALQGLQEQRTAVPADARDIPGYVRLQRAEMARVAATAAADEPLDFVYLLAWNHLALDATALDHSTQSSMFGEQFGPTRTSRALAIVHLAMFEAVNAISRKHPSYQDIQHTILANIRKPEDQVTPATASIDRAIVEAAYRTLKDLYPKKDALLLKTAYDVDRERLGNGAAPEMILGAQVGAEAAKIVLAMRHFDGSELPDLTSDDFKSDNPRTWHQDPITKLGPALGGNWARVKPFLIRSADAFRLGTGGLPTHPSFESADFIEAYKEVKTLGGDPNAMGVDRWLTPTTRTGAATPSDPMPADNTNQTFVGIFWGYDGTALLCAPPRLYNMIATSVALSERQIVGVENLAQYLALVNLTLADAGIAAWDSKYHFLFPRPITYLRTVSADRTPEGARHPDWTPLGAPVTNGTDEGRNLSPPFPAYPSGHAVFGAALFRAMTRYFQSIADANSPFPDKGISFRFVSDEFNGLNRGPGETERRKKVEVTFTDFDEAADLNARSRIYLGIHWKFDADHGILQGKAVADDVFEKFVQPSP